MPFTWTEFEPLVETLPKLDSETDVALDVVHVRVVELPAFTTFGDAVSVHVGACGGGGGGVFTVTVVEQLTLAPFEL